VPGAREVIEDGLTGLLFAVGDIEHLAAQTLRAAADPALRADIGRAARVSVEPHAIDAAVAAYETALREVVAQRTV
jgi:glycosyltransferase involved in cell wall biosynthesis